MPAPARSDTRLRRRREGHIVTLTDDGIDRSREAARRAENLYEPEQHRAAAPRRTRRCGPTRSTSATSTTSSSDGEVIIVDEFTGRLMHGRRWSDGLHQAVEAKEGVKIQHESQTLATITFQNYFRMYNKLAGMTGTAETEAEEFQKIYNLDVVVDPDQPPMVRKDHADRRLHERARQVQGRRRRDRGDATRRASPCWSAPSASRSRRSSASMLDAARASRTTC